MMGKVATVSRSIDVNIMHVTPIEVAEGSHTLKTNGSVHCFHSCCAHYHSMGNQRSVATSFWGTQKANKRYMLPKCYTVCSSNATL